MFAKRRLDAVPDAVEKVEAALAVVLPFPAGAKQPVGPETRAAAAVAQLAPSPAHGERPTLLTPRTREWLKAALIASVILHGTAFVIFELRFEDDLERVAGAAAALSSDGTITIPVGVVAETPLPSAPSPTNATAADAEKPSEAPPQQEVAEEKQPELTDKQLQALIPLPPEPVPVEIPQPPVRTAAEQLEPEAPAETVVLEEKPPLPLPRQPVREAKKEEPEKPKAEQDREKQKSARSSPSVAASPSRAAAAANSAGSAGAGGAADTGGRAAVSSYQAQVLAHLSRFRVYPPEARSRGMTGVARVRFSLGRDGQVLSASLAGGSGAAMLDEAAMDMVRRASPFPPFPTGVTQARMEFGAPIRFDLR